MMRIMIADGPHAGVRAEISPTAPPHGLERTVQPCSDSWLAALLDPEPVDRDTYWYIARYDADPDFAPQTAKGGLKRAYCFRDLRVISKTPPRRDSSTPRPVAAKLVDELTPLTLF
jgi:hypothetical protein